MIGPKFLSPEDRRELLACVKRQREDHGIARRANALLLLDDGKFRAEIAGVLYLDDDTVRGWRKQYLAEGWDAVAHDGWKGGQSRMTGAQGAELCSWFEGRICRSAHEIRAHIRAKSGICYSHSGGATVSAVLPAVNADTLREVIAPVVDEDIVLVTDGHRADPRCPAAIGAHHEALNLSRSERVRGAFHITDGQQPTQPVAGFLAALPRRRDQISRQRPAMVPAA